MRPTPNAKLVRGVEPGSFALESPYDDGLVGELKKLPRRDRRWEEPIWIIADRHWDAVIKLCVHYYGSCQTFGEGGEEDAYYDRRGRSVQERLF